MSTNNIYSISFDHFKMLNEKARKEISSQAIKENHKIASKFFEDNPGVDWIVIAHKKGNIIKKGQSNEELFEKDIEKLEKEVGSVVFVFSRPVIVEELKHLHARTHYLCAECTGYYTNDEEDD